MWGGLEDGVLDRIVVVSPHFDDAVLGASHVLGAHPGSTVVTITGGRPEAYPDPPTEWDASGGFRAGDDVVGARREEDRAALAVLGARSTWLEFVDHQYVPPDRRSSPAEVAPALERALRDADPTAVFVPMGIANPDHALTHAAALAVRAALGTDDGAPAWFAYEDAGYVQLPGLLAWRVSGLFRGGLWPTPAIVPAPVDMAAKPRRAGLLHQSAAPAAGRAPVGRAPGGRGTRAVLAPRGASRGVGGPDHPRRPGGSVTALGAGTRVEAGTRVLVTGASSGIGAAVAVEAARRGAEVALVARRADRLEAVAAACRTAGGVAHVHAADLGDPDRAGALALEIWDALGALDVVVNNAAVPMRRPAARLTMDDVSRTMTVNFLSPPPSPWPCSHGWSGAPGARWSTCRASEAASASPTRRRTARVEVRPGRLERVAGHRPGRHRRVRPPRAARCGRHRDLGPARQRPGRLHRAPGARRGGGGRPRGLRVRPRFRALHPRHAGRRGDEASGHRRVHGRHGGHGRRGPRGRRKDVVERVSPAQSCGPRSSKRR